MTIAAIALSLLFSSAPQEAFLPADDLQFLQDLAAAVVAASRVPANAKVGAIGPNVTGGTLIRPGGRACYPAFWIRDYAMSLDAGIITPDEQRHALLLTAAAQQPKLWNLPSGSVVPSGSIPDHISFGNKPIFFPGTLEDYEGQGGGQWGKIPALDDHFYFIHMAAEYVRQTSDAAVLKTVVDGKAVIERLERAFLMPPSHPDTGIVFADPQWRGVTFGFVDAVTHTGDLLFCSLLKYQAAREMAWLYQKLGDDASVRRYRNVAAALRQALPTFATPKGLLRASTGTSGQPDVWGTAFAVYIGALDDPAKTAACQALAKAYADDTLAWHGNIRHVLTTDDFSPTTAWESTVAAKNHYQNGAYWGTPVGWVCYAIAQVDRPAAQKRAHEYIQELRDGDFRKGPEFGSPWECMHPDGNYRQNPVYMTSVTCPLAAFKKIMK